jgi:hypothetical protein
MWLMLYVERSGVRSQGKRNIIEGSNGLDGSDRLFKWGLVSEARQARFEGSLPKTLNPIESNPRERVRGIGPPSVRWRMRGG